LLTGDDWPRSPAAARRFASLVARRVGREPVAYILGRRAFRDVELIVDPRVLIPRPETELLVEAALELPEGARVIDVGTGSGAVALALKHERPDLEVTGSDVSADALAVARANGDRLGLAVTWRRADLLTRAGGPWDAVLANPPYVPDPDLSQLAPEIRRHEPPAALSAGEDGLAVIGWLVDQVAARAVPWGVPEAGVGNADAGG